MTDHRKIDRRALNAKLRELGMSRPYAWQIATGNRAPSLTWALRIEAETGIPPSAWPLPEVRGLEAAA